MRALTVILTILLILFLILSPAPIRRHLGVDEYRAYWDQPDPDWKGRIEIWHIASFRTYQGSVTNHLQARADAYCRWHAGVDIDVVGLTEEKYRDRLGRGLTPDAYSFQGGLVYAEQLSPVPLPQAALDSALRGNIRLACIKQDVYAMPYLMSGYLLASNRQLVADLTGEPIEAPYDELLQAALDAGQLAMPPILAARCSLAGTLAASDGFASGKLALAGLDARGMGEIKRGEKNVVSADFAPLCNFSDQVFYIGASRSASPEQRQALSGFLAFLLTDDEQSRLCTIGAIPVSESAEAVFAEDMLTQLNETLKDPIVPDPFAYQRHRDALLLEAEAALGGDEHALRSFQERMALICSGQDESIAPAETHDVQRVVLRSYSL